MATIPNQIAVQAFLKNGRTDGIDNEELACLCDQQVQKASRKSLGAALKIAETFLAAAAHRGGILSLTAHRAVARITHMKGDHKNALTAYLKARSLAKRDRMTRARIDRSLIDVYMYLGMNADARRAARRAMTTFARLNANDDLAKTKVNFANLYHRQDRHREAEILYRESADYFTKIGNDIAAARCNYNRANTLVQMFDLEPARVLYENAERIYMRAGYELDACDTRYGLAWLLMLAGEFHRALLLLSRCEKVYRASEDSRGVALCIMDRAEAYLNLGLYTDALLAARESGIKFQKLGLRYELAKSALFRGQAAHALGKVSEARRALNRANKGFLAERNPGFLGVGNLLSADLASTSSNRRRIQLQRARKRFSKAHLPMWEAMCDIRDAADPSRRSAALSRMATNRAVKEVPQLFAMWKTIEGDYYMDRGDASKARKSWRMAADRLDMVRAQLPPLELRTQFRRYRRLPHPRLVDIDWERRPSEAAAWSERFKTAGVWASMSFDRASDATRRAVGEKLDALARQVAAMGRQLGTHIGSRGGTGAVERKIFARLRRQIREHMLEVESIADASMNIHEGLISDFRRVSRNVPIIQFHIGEKDILGFVHRREDISVHRFRDGRRQLAELMRRWRFILEGEMLSQYLGSNGSRELEIGLWKEFGDWLWTPLDISGSEKRLLILPEGELANLPWAAVTIGNETLAERHYITCAPSLRHYLAAGSVRHRTDDILIFAGPAADIPEAGREVSTLRRMFGAGATVVDPCLREDWPSAGNARVWHFSGHIELYAANPFYSYLLLDDGPLFAADFRLKKCRVDLVTLAGCRSGEQIASPGEETTGLVRSLLEMGARAVVASPWQVSDKTSRLWMESFYSHLIDGTTVSDAARLAGLELREKYPSAYHWAAFAVLGVGDKGVDYGQKT